jgi:hypothetical protein
MKPTYLMTVYWLGRQPLSAFVIGRKKYSDVKLVSDFLTPLGE